MRRVRKVIAPTAVGLAIAAAVLLPRDAFMRDARDLYRLLCDASFAAAVALIGASTIAWLARRGAYDNFTKALRGFWLPFLRQTEAKPAGGADGKPDERRRSPAYPVCVGLAFGVASAVFYILYMGAR